MKNSLLIGCFCVAATLTAHAALTNEQTAPVAVSTPTDTRYGLFKSLDNRSEYGQDFFPEPFLVDDSDMENNEARLDWLHTRAGGSGSDMVTAEIEKGFDMVTLELEIPYERDTDDGAVTEGFDNIDLGARTPLYQCVSPNELFDTTFGTGFEAGIPTQSPVGKNAELVPKIFNDTKVGNFSLQSIAGYSILFGPGDDGGLETFEYGFVFGYTIDHRQLPLPDVLQLIPIFEIAGETEMNKGNQGYNSVLGNAAFRVNLKSIGPVQPRLGLGFVFPLNDNARNEVHYGIYTSFVFEF
jgi:hypothetical protein